MCKVITLTGAGDKKKKKRYKYKIDRAFHGFKYYGSNKYNPYYTKVLIHHKKKGRDATSLPTLKSY